MASLGSLPSRQKLQMSSQQTAPPLKKILILGGGFGGMETYRQLHRRLHPMKGRGARIELTNRTNYLTFTPMLHEVATGSVAREHVVQPIREMMACCGNDFHQAEVLRVDPERKEVRTSQGVHTYDILVVALGVQQGYFGVAGAREHALPLKQLEDAVRVRNAIIRAYEHASEHHDRRETADVTKYLHFVVVGGGASGVELAGQIADLSQDELKKLYGDVPHAVARVTLIEAGSRLLGQFSGRCTGRAEARLKKMGVTVLLNDPVFYVTAEGVVLRSGKSIPTKNVFWTAGTESGLGKLFPSILLNERGLLKTSNTQKVHGASHIFALGDCAELPEEKSRAPASAQAAVQAAATVAANVVASLKGVPLRHHKFKSKGDIIPIGDWYAIFEKGNFCFSGRLAWWMRRTVFLMNMFSWSRRLRVVSDWTIQIWQPRDTAEL